MTGTREGATASGRRSCCLFSRVERRWRRRTHCADAKTAGTCRELLKLAPAHSQLLHCCQSLDKVRPLNGYLERP